MKIVRPALLNPESKCPRGVKEQRQKARSSGVKDSKGTSLHVVVMEGRGVERRQGRGTERAWWLQACMRGEDGTAFISPKFHSWVDWISPGQGKPRGHRLLLRMRHQPGTFSAPSRQSSFLCFTCGRVHTHEQELVTSPQMVVIKATNRGLDCSGETRSRTEH